MRSTLIVKGSGGGRYAQARIDGSEQSVTVLNDPVGAAVKCGIPRAEASRLEVSSR